MRVISGGDDGLVKIWCVRTGLLIFTLRGHSNCISDLSIDSKNSVLAVGSLDGYVSFWDLQMGRPLLTINVFSPVVTIEFRPTDSTPAEVILAVTCSDGYAKFWAIDLQKRTYSQSPIKFHCKSLARDVIRCASLSPGGRRFIVGSTDGIIRMFRVPEIDEIKSGQPKSMALPHVQYLDDHEGYINSVHFSSTGTSFVTSSSDGCIRLWSNDLEILIKNDPIARFRKFPHLTTSGWTSCLFATFKENERPQKVPLVSFCCSDRALISAVCQTRELVIFSLNCEKLNDDPVHIKYHTGEIQILTTNPSDDRIVLSADASGRVAVWFIDQEAPAKNRLGHMTARLKIKRVFEYYQPSVLFLDGCFSNDGVYFSLVDDLGRISLFGAGVSATPYSVAPLSQFFPGDWNELTFDSNHNAFDAVLSVSFVPIIFIVMNYHRYPLK